MYIMEIPIYMDQKGQRNTGCFLPPRFISLLKKY